MRPRIVTHHGRTDRGWPREGAVPQGWVPAARDLRLGRRALWPAAARPGAPEMVRFRPRGSSSAGRAAAFQLYRSRALCSDLGHPRSVARSCGESCGVAHSVTTGSQRMTRCVAQESVGADDDLAPWAGIRAYARRDPSNRVPGGVDVWVEPTGKTRQPRPSPSPSEPLAAGPSATDPRARHSIRLPRRRCPSRGRRQPGVDRRSASRAASAGVAEARARRTA
jgi:hypothetical protein